MKAKRVRIEMPVMLYVDVDVSHVKHVSKYLAEAKTTVFDWLGAPDEEVGITLSDLPDGLSHARLYTCATDAADSHKAVIVDEVSE